MNSKTKKRVTVIIFIAVILFCLFLAWKIGIPLIRLANQPEMFRQWIESKGIFGKLIYVAIVFFQVIVAFLPGEPFEIAGGYAFGTIQGTFLCLMGSALGSIVVFLLVRRFGPSLAEIFFSKEKLDKLNFLKESPNRRILFWFIYILPGTPKDLLSYFAGLTDISLKHWILMNLLGRIPSIITSTIGGDAFGNKNYGFAAIVFVITLFLSVICIIIYKCILHRKQENEINHESKNRK